jgi:relaxase-like protein
MPGGIDAELVEWGELLFSRAKRGSRGSGGGGVELSRLFTPRTVRNEIRLAVRRATQVMVKVTGGGRGMGVIRSHLKYIDREREGLIDQNGVKHEGAGARKDLARSWAAEGTPIPERSHRREAFNIMWSMPAGTEPELLLSAVRAVAAKSFAEHRYVMALHAHQANPHVHLVVRAESDVSARRLNPRKADLHQWRAEFATELRARGIEAAATRQTVRGEVRRYPALWEQKAREEGRLRSPLARPKRGAQARRSRDKVLRAWHGLSAALARSADLEDRRLAMAIDDFVGRMRLVREGAAKSQRDISPIDRKGPER